MSEQDMEQHTLEQRYRAMIYLAMFTDRNTRVAAIRMGEAMRNTHGASNWGAAVELANQELTSTAETFTSVSLAEPDWVKQVVGQYK